MSLINKFFEENESFIESLCEKISSKLPSQIFRTNDSPYLKRSYFLKRDWFVDMDSNRIEDTRDQPYWKRLIPGVYLHYFYRGDLDRELHNHPWSISLSLILTNGYVEERGSDTGIKTRRLRPGDFNKIKADDFHRVDLIDPTKGSWTLFFAGARVQDWGFKDWSDSNSSFVPHQDQIHNHDRQIS